MAKQTVAILERGAYTTPSGREVSIAAQLERSVKGTRVIGPDDWTALVKSAPEPQDRKTIVEMSGETTLAAARRLHDEEPSEDILALNFASAKNPGGGFLSGSEAQEESLARSSGLYKMLLAGERYYVVNRANESKLYTDHAIYSPQVPVFRADDGTLLENPYLLSFHTAPAPNAGAIDPRSHDHSLILAALLHRMTHLFALAASMRQRRLILGAWGCGVFRNDPNQVAEAFRATLFEHGWSRHFSKICFAVYNTSPERPTYAAFRRVLGPHLTRELP